MLRHGEQRNFLRGISAILVSAALLLTSVPTVAANLSQMPARPPAASVSVRSATALPSKVKTTASLNMRTGPRTAYKILATIPKGTAVIVISRSSSGWYKLSYSGRTGWINNKYVTTGSFAPAPTGPNRISRVVLTFDDCPRTLGSFTAAINYAAGNDMGLVLAPTGNCISSFESRYGMDLAGSARAKGQWVINHSVSHRDLRTLNRGVHTNFSRPPYGAIDAGVRCGYDRFGMAIWTWSPDTMDWSVKSKAITV